MYNTIPYYAVLCWSPLHWGLLYSAITQFEVTSWVMNYTEKGELRFSSGIHISELISSNVANKICFFFIVTASVVVMLGEWKTVGLVLKD